MTKQKYHQLYETLPPIDLQNLALAAFRGAEYHLDRARRLAEEGKAQYAQLNYNQFVWEVRAFFWELTASYEMMLQWANREFALGIGERKVSQGTVLAATPSREVDRWLVVRTCLEKAGTSDWYFEIQAYRNYNIHRAFTSMEAVVRMPEPFAYDPSAPIEKGQLVIFQITPVREGQQYGGDLFTHLKAYVAEMAKLGQTIFNKSDRSEPEPG